MNAGLFLINYLSRGEDGGWWFYWPLAGWGIGLAVQTLVVVFGVCSPGWKMRKAGEIYRRSRGTPPGG